MAARNAAVAVVLLVTLLNLLIHLHFNQTVVHSLAHFRPDRPTHQLELKTPKDCPPPVNLFGPPRDEIHAPKEETDTGLIRTMELPVCERPPNNNRVYLLETAKDYVIPKVLCTIESLARHMPEWCIVLYVRNYNKSKTTEQELKLLASTPNARILNLQPDEVVMGSPFEGMFQTARFQKAGEKRLFYAHYSDILRVALLHMYGGIFMDLDVIAMRSVDLAPQYLVRTGHGGVANGMMKFHRHSFLLMRYAVNVWTDYAPEHYSRLFYVLCETVEDHCKHLGLDIKGIDMQAGQIQECDGVTIFGFNSGAFAPFAAEKALETLFNHSAVDQVQRTLDHSGSAFIHYSGNARGNYNTRVNVKTDQTVFARVFRQNCPLCTDMFDQV